MRFVADGPALPDELLIARDEGQVIFFCGAGVSQARANLPDFRTLATRVIDDLGSTTRSLARRLMAAANAQHKIVGIGGLLPADRVFALLEREFEAADVREAVARALKPRAGVDLSAHRTLLDLARGPDGRARIVTTNFDLLFEASDAKLPIHTPPLLPDPRRPQDFNGIVHLHGRVTADYASAHDSEFVLSSADFGRAYLADGWATRFIQGLMEGYQLVFVGYSADDPPVQYLLEALSDRALARGGLFALQAGRLDEAHALWRSKGVQAIAYDEADRHSALWRTLEAWARRARDPAAWRTQVVRRAARGPMALAPHERGWVKHMTMFPDGIRRFAEAKPPAEWLCVLDPSIRYATPERYHGDGTTFDPFDAYGLDEDEPPPIADPEQLFVRREIPAGAWDAFAPSSSDSLAAPGPMGGLFRGVAASQAANLSLRHAHLAQWLVDVAHEPASVWWASGQSGLHPDITESVLRRFAREASAESPVEQAWRRLAQSWGDRPRTTYRNWYELAAGVRRVGWSLSTLSGLEELLQPTVGVSRPYSSARRPPPVKILRRSALINLEVEHPHIGDGIDIPDNLLEPVLVMARRALERGQDLITETFGFDASPLPPITPDPAVEGGGFDRTHGIAPLFFQYITFLQRLLARSADEARIERLRWRRGDPAFDRLHIWASGLAALTSPDEAADALLALDEDAFWGSRHQRDLMLSLRERWTEFPTLKRRTLERRLLKGRPRWHRESPADHRQYGAISALDRLTWLAIEGCALSADLVAARARLESRVPGYAGETARHAAASLESRGGAVGEDPDASGLRDVPPKLVIEIAQELSRREWHRLTDRRPLVGLARTRPTTLLRALSFSDRDAGFSEWGWRALLASEGPVVDRPRMQRQIAERLAKLPSQYLAVLIHDVTGWFAHRSEALVRTAPQTYEHLWAALLNTLRNHPESARSAIRSSAPEWVTSALNAPTGRLAESLMNHPDRQPAEGQGFPESWLAKATELVSLRNDGGRLAAVIFLYNLPWFFQHDRSWAETHLLERRRGTAEDQEAFWAGVLWRGEIPTRPIYDLIKSDMLELVGSQAERSQRTAQLAGYIMAGWMRQEGELGGTSITDAEMRDALVAGSEDFRTHALWQLERWYKGDRGDDVRRRVLQMIRDVWPRQRVVKSAKVSERLADFALSGGEDFPELVDAVLPHLVPVRDHFSTVLSLNPEQVAVLGRYPSALLRLLAKLLPPQASQWPYDAKAVVERLGGLKELARDPVLADLRRRMAAG